MFNLKFPGDWKTFISRPENSNLPIYEAKRKYKLEIDTFNLNLTLYNPIGGAGIVEIDGRLYLSTEDGLFLLDERGNPIFPED